MAKPKRRRRQPGALKPAGLSELLGVPQVAAYLGLHRVTVTEFAREGKLPAFKVGREWRFRITDIEAWVEERRQARETFAQRFDDLWGRLRQKAEQAGYGAEDVPRLIEEVRRAKRQRAASGA